MNKACPKNGFVPRILQGHGFLRGWRILLSTWPIASGGSKVSKRLGASKVQSGNRCRAAWLAALWAPGCKSHSWDQQVARLKAAAKAFAGSEQSVPSASPHFCNSLLYFSSVFSTVPKRAPFGFILENGKTKWFRQSDVTKPYDGLHILLLLTFWRRPCHVIGFALR